MDDLDPNLVKTLPISKDQQEYQMKYLCDEVTFMMFDLERGGFLSTRGARTDINDLWAFTYKRIPVEESVTNEIQTIVSNFFIVVYYNGNVVFDYEVYGGERRFRINKVNGFHVGMFINELDKYRKNKFEK